MYYFNEYYDVIDDFIAIYNVLEMALSSILLKIGEAITLCNCPVFYGSSCTSGPIFRVICFTSELLLRYEDKKEEI